jgi:tetratricopeptide (TPR) repeat protein
VRAAELRLEKRPAAQVEAVLQNNDRTGFILVRPIYQQLITFEKAEPAMSFYFPTLVSNISVAAQEKRFQNFEFAGASEKIAPGGIAGEAEATSADLELKQELMQGDRQIAMQDGKGAAATFQSVLDQHPKLPRALYGLAIASVLQGDGQKAENLFEQLVHTPGNASNNILAPTPDILAWSHVYLGRIRDLQGNRGQAEAEYKAALAVAGAPEQARVAAQQGINAPYAPPSKEAQH